MAPNGSLKKCYEPNNMAGSELESHHPCGILSVGDVKQDMSMELCSSGRDALSCLTFMRMLSASPVLSHVL